MSAEGSQGPSGVLNWFSLRRCALVAQLDRAFGYEPKGRRFESFRAHQFIKLWVTELPRSWGIVALPSGRFRRRS